MQLKIQSRPGMTAKEWSTMTRSKVWMSKKKSPEPQDWGLFRLCL